MNERFKNTFNLSIKFQYASMCFKALVFFIFKKKKQANY